MHVHMLLRRFGFLVLSLTVLAAGCARKESTTVAAADKGKLRKVVLQTDWFPQGEHGGFYQALAKGFYREAGLDVEILPGGPNSSIKVKVAKGDADFGMNRSDDVMVAIARGLPLVMVAAVLEHDPQALMVHDASPVKSFKDLKDRTLTANVGMSWIPYLQKKYNIAFTLKPSGYGVAGFLADKDAIQQCFVTNEPYFAQERGMPVRLLPLAASGYDVYHTLICRRELVRSSPETVQAFINASLRGWHDYLEGDPAPGNALILERNPQMMAGLLDYTRGELILRQLVTGDPGRDEGVGRLSVVRLKQQMETLLDLKVLDAPIKLDDAVATNFVPGSPR